MGLNYVLGGIIIIAFFILLLSFIARPGVSVDLSRNLGLIFLLMGPLGIFMILNGFLGIIAPKYTGLYRLLIKNPKYINSVTIQKSRRTIQIDLVESKGKKPTKKRLHFNVKDKKVFMDYINMTIPYVSIADYTSNID